MSGSTLKMVIIDECSQVTEHLLTLIVVQLQEFKDSHRPWGNISVVLQGDFHQFPPTFGRALYKENGATFGQFETIILKRQGLHTTKTPPKNITITVT